MVWLTRDPIEPDLVGVWVFEPYLVSKAVWWADCPHGATPLASYYHDLPVEECLQVFGLVPPPGKKVQV